MQARRLRYSERASEALALLCKCKWDACATLWTEKNLAGEAPPYNSFQLSRITLRPTLLALMSLQSARY